MTDYAAYQSFAVDGSGNTVSGANIEVRSETTGNLAVLFSGRTGGAKSNPFTADSDGYFIFYTVGDFLKIRVYTGPSGAPLTERFFRYVAVGLAGGYDVNTVMQAIPDGTAAAPGLALATAPTTGVYSPGGGIWAVSTAGVERTRIDAAGLIGFGAATATGTNVRYGKNITGATSAQGVKLDGAVQSDVTVAAALFQTAFASQAAAFTLASAYHFQAAQGTIGAGSAVTSQVGFFADATLTGGVSNFGFYGNIAAATNRWNFYGGGTARNYMAGALSIGATTDPGTGGLYVNGVTVLNGAVTFNGQTNFEGQSVSPLQTLTDGTTISTWDASLGQKAKVTLGAAGRTMAALTNVVEGVTYFFWVIQDATGGRTITTWSSAANGFDFGTTGQPTLTLTGSRADLLTFEAVSVAGTLKLRFTGIAKGFA